MSGGRKPTWTAREIVLEFFPATQERLVPRPLRYRVVAAGEGAVHVLEGEATVARLVPVPATGNPTGQLCCDLCGRMGPRRFLSHYRVELPGSNGRRFRYLGACRDRSGCETRRLDDAGIEAILAPGA